jgi:aquaporin NIP
MDNEEIPSVPSTPATPGTPGAPLFGGFKSERTGNGSVVGRSKSLLKNLKCFSVEEWTLEDGALPKVSCSLPPPPVPLAKKVHLINHTYILHIRNVNFNIIENYSQMQLI